MKKSLLFVAALLLAVVCGFAQGADRNQEVSLAQARRAVDEASHRYDNLYAAGKEDISGLRREIDRIGDEVARLKGDRKASNENVKAFKDVLKIRKDALKLQKKAGASKEHLDLMKDDIRESERQYKDAKAFLNRLDNRIKDYKKDIKSLKRRIRDIEKEISDAKKELKARQKELKSASNPK